jgi:hypothetical protein
MLPFKNFIESAEAILRADDNVLGLAIGGSWLTKEMDEYSDLDLVVVLKNKIAGKEEMISYSSRLGILLNAFTGDHVGEPRLLICLFDDPLLHVDIKFLTLSELETRIEDPEIIFDRDNQLADVISSTSAKFPMPDYQWIEDRFWTWIHYTTGKIARGELFEAIDAIGFLRSNVLGPLLHIKNNSLPRGVRKLETTIDQSAINLLQETVPGYDKISTWHSLNHIIKIYQQLRKDLFKNIEFRITTEKKAFEYLSKLNF